VADDESVRLGGGAVAGNLALLTRVRTANPDAFIIYRPHPDVTAGHRRGALPDPVRAGLADQVDQGSAIAALVGAVDEVHTLTSLAGFEALLRGRIVVTYGQPFYAGWGLTRDQAPLERRRRRLQLEELVAGALILYPLYVDPATGLPCGPEVLVARLAQPEYWRPSLLTRARRIQGRLRRRWPMGPAAPGFMAGPARP
jgi:capsular polysaccharide export protein